MVDVNAQIDAVTRSVRTTQEDAGQARVQSLAQVYPSGIADVWDAVTTPERIARWFLPLSGELRIGGRYQFEGNAGGEVLECSPPADGRAGFRATWEYGGGVSWVRVELQAIDEETTRFELVHTALVAELPAEFWELYGPGATGVGWDSGLLGLALHLAGDGSIRPEDADTWMLGEEGGRFARRAADGWAEAQIAAGDDPEASRRAADATYAFYTGKPSDAASAG